MSLIDEFKGLAKEDADLSEIESKLGSYINTSELTKDNFIDVAKQHPSLMSAFDSEVSKRVAKGVENFKERDMVELLKSREEEIRAEINPKETPEQKELREVREELASIRNEKKLTARQDELSIIAKDLGFEPILARRLASLPDAEEVIKETIEWKNGVLGTQLKGQYPQNPPKTSAGIQKGLSNMSDSELYAAAKSNPANKAAIIEEVNRRMKPR